MPSIVVDAHQDIAYNMLMHDRDYRRSAAETRLREAGPVDQPLATLGLPDALRGHVAVVFATLFTEPSRKPLDPDKPPSVVSYRTPAQAHDAALRQWDVYQRLRDGTPQLARITTHTELDAVLATWADDAPESGRKQGMALLMENADPIVEPAQFEEWHERGVRIVGPAWAASRYCGGTGEPGGLTAAGYELLDVMASFSAMLDLSHMAEEAYLQAVERYEGPIIASHSNSRRFRDSDRHLSDTMIRLLAERDGVIGTVMFNAFLRNGYSKGDHKESVPFDTVIDAIDTICQITGSARHAAIGSDFDGGFGSQHIPAGLDTVADLAKIGDGLRARGYSEDDVDAVLSGNMLRKLREALS
ncbi:MAG TPA: membrane dipeptidase [Candidatus Limnocylindrales bacterium]|nr:membrane dipeptidase [Candidatus Limnocylindrales bacterium]